MVLVLFAALLFLKYEYPMFAVDACLTVLLALCLLSIIITIVCAMISKFSFKSLKYVYTEGDTILVTVDSRTSVFMPRLKIMAQSSYLQRKKMAKGIKYSVSTGKKNYFEITDIVPGNLVVRISRVICIGIFGIFKIGIRRRDLSMEYLVYPKPVEFDISSLKKIILSGDGEMTNMKGDDYSELYDVREYEEGDDLKYIHRALTSKYGEYMIKVGTFSKREIYIYTFQNAADFDELCVELGKIVYMYETIVQEKKLYFCINDNNKWQIIVNRSQLDEFINSKYKEYVI